MVSFVVAMAKNRVIGNNSGVPWGTSQKADVKHFRDLTIGHTIIMGRKTFDKFDEPLKNRMHVVVTRNPGIDTEQVRYRTAEQVISYIKQNDQELFVIGGQEIFELLMPYAQRLQVTEIDAEYEGDTYFPKIDEKSWQKTDTSCFEADEENKNPYCFIEYKRI